MLDSGEILAEVLDSIGHVYFRPLMYGGNADGVEVALGVYHHLWAAITEQREALQSAIQDVTESRNCCNKTFAGHYRECVVGGGAAEAEVAAQVVSGWRRIDAALGLDVPDVRRQLIGD